MTAPRPIHRNVKGPDMAVAPVLSTGGEDLSELLAKIECQIEVLGFATLDTNAGCRRWTLTPGTELRRYLAEAVQQADGSAALAALKAEAAQDANPYLTFRWGMSTQALQKLLDFLQTHEVTHD
jgi:hypothetical protein